MCILTHKTILRITQEHILDKNHKKFVTSHLIQQNEYNRASKNPIFKRSPNELRVKFM